ncbi:MAG: site-2 protease family protein [Chlamydiota bacterium]|nr:site-2 protease family protein [Chlamydiota bacterium]
MMIPVRIHPFFWLLAGIIGWLSTYNIVGTVIWMVIIFVSVLVHEYGHAITAVYFGQNPIINLVGFGGLTRREGGKLKLWQEFIIVMNGPIFGLILCLGALLLNQFIAGRLGSLTTYTLTVTAYINLFWTIVNLLPVLPLDGGRLFKIVLQGMFGFKGVKIATFLSLALCGLLGLSLFAFGLMLPGILFMFLTFENYRGWAALRSMTEVDQDEGLWQQIKAADMAVHLGKHDEGWEILETVREKAGGGVLSITATQMMANILVIKKQYQDAYAMVLPILDKMTPEFLSTAHQLAYKAGDVDRAIELGKNAYQESPTPEIAAVNALCHAHKNEVEPTVGWLKTAYNQGYPSFPTLLEREEFNSLRSQPKFQELLSLK